MRSSNLRDIVRTCTHPHREHAPLLVPLVRVRVPRRREIVSQRRLFLEYLSRTDIGTDDSWIANDLRLPLVVDLAVMSRHVTARRDGRTRRLIRSTLRLPSGPMLVSRSRSSDEPRLNAGEAGRPDPADMAGENGASLTDVCLPGLLISGGGPSSSDVSCGSSLRLNESNCAFHIRSISDL